MLRLRCIYTGVTSFLLLLASMHFTSQQSRLVFPALEFITWHLSEGKEDHSCVRQILCCIHIYTALYIDEQRVYANVIFFEACLPDKVVNCIHSLLFTGLSYLFL